MARICYTQCYFHFGEVAPELFGNVEFDGYNSCLAKCENFIPSHTGGLHKRTGTKFANTIDGPNSVLFSFVVSETESYILEFTEYLNKESNTCIRFFNKRGLCKYEDNDGTEDMVVPLVGLDKKQLRRVRLIKQGDVLIISTPRGIFVLYKQIEFSDDGAESWWRWKIKPNIESVFSTLKFTMPPMDLINGNTEKGFKYKREGNVWTFYPADYDAWREAQDKSWDNIPSPKREYFNDFHTSYNIDACQMFFFIVQKDDGTLQRYWLKISGGTPPDVTKKDWGYFTAVLDKAYSPDNGDWLFEGDKGKEPFYKHAFEAFGYGAGFIDSSTMFCGRLILAKGQAVFVSKLGDFLDFEDGMEDTDAVKAQVNLNEESVIKWVLGTDKLFVGSASGIFVHGDISTTSIPITPKNFEIKMMSTGGANDLPPVATPYGVLFVEKYGKRVSEIYLEADSQTYKSKDRSLTGFHLTKSGIVSHCFMGSPYDMYFAACADGTLCSMTYHPENNFSAWCRIKLGGDAKVRAVTTFSSEKSENLFMIVERIIQGEKKYYLEYITNPYEAGVQEEYKQYFVDGGKTFKDILPHSAIKAPVDFIKIKKAKSYFKEHRRDNVFLLQTFNEAQPLKLKVLEVKSDGIRVLPDDFRTEEGYAYTKLGNVVSYENKELFSLRLANVIGNAHLQATLILQNSGLTYKNDLPLDGNRLFLQEISGESYGCFVYSGDTIKGTLNPDAECYILITPEKIEVSCCPLSVNIKGEIVPGKQLMFRECLGIDAKAFNNKEFDVLKSFYDQNTKQTVVYLNGKNLNLFDDGEDRTIQMEGMTLVRQFNTLKGLEHLEGETLDILADGEIIKNKKVKNGQIELDKLVGYACAGYRYEAIAQTLPYYGGKITGSSLGSKGSVDKTHMRLHYSLGGRYGTDRNNMQPIDDAKFTAVGESEYTGERRTLKTGDFELPILNNSVMVRSLRLEHDDPCSFIMLAFGATVTVSEV